MCDDQHVPDFNNNSDYYLEKNEDYYLCDQIDNIEHEYDDIKEQKKLNLYTEYCIGDVFGENKDNIKLINDLLKSPSSSASFTEYSTYQYQLTTKLLEAQTTKTTTTTNDSFKPQKRCYDDDQSSSIAIRQTKRAKSIVTLSEMNSYFKLLESQLVREFFEFDKCCLISDKYALAMVFTYFKRAKLTEFTLDRFFLALYLANDIEEDVDDYKYEIFPWAIGRDWRKKYQMFLKRRDEFLRLLDYRAIVSRKCCEEVMNMVPDHEIWKRSRSVDHGGATRSYIIRKCDLLNGFQNIENDVVIPTGPYQRPRPCPLCTLNNKKTLILNNKNLKQPQQQQQYHYPHHIQQSQARRIPAKRRDNNDSGYYENSTSNTNN